MSLKSLKYLENISFFDRMCQQFPRVFVLVCNPEPKLGHFDKLFSIDSRALPHLLLLVGYP